MEIKAKDLLVFCEMLVAHLEASNCHTLTVDRDLYWSIGFKERYDPTKQPAELGLGSLQDDLDRLRAALQSGRPVGSDLSCLGAILQAIGEKVAA